jgi:hypothetical protein
MPNEATTPETAHELGGQVDPLVMPRPSLCACYAFLLEMKMTFEEQVLQAMKQKVLDEIKDTSFTKLDYGQRTTLPSGLMDKLWSSINWDEVVEQVRPAIQVRICNAIIGAMETETKTDIKKLLAVDGVRQKLRMEVYPKLMQVLDDA